LSENYQNVQTIKEPRVDVFKNPGMVRHRFKPENFFANYIKLLRKRMDKKISETGKWLTSVLNGYYRYYGVSGNIDTLERFQYQILMRWFSMLKRRSQRKTLNWEHMGRIANQWLPEPKVYHPHPL
jgi:hypothetical protein